MPNPFKGGHAPWNVDSLEKRPELAVHIGIIAGMWSAVEFQLGHIVTAILHTDALVGMTVFSVIKAEAARLDAIDAIASDRLSSEDLATFMALKAKVRTTGKLRDAMCHNLWGVAESKPDSLILHDTRKWAAFSASARSAHKGEAEKARHQKNFDALVRSSMEYTERDFMATKRDIKALYFELFEFALKLDRQHPPPATEPLPEFPKRLEIVDQDLGHFCN